MPRKHNLDVIKGVAILLVIITHFSWNSDERLKYFFPFWVDMAVPIFMCITGYVYSVSFSKKGVRDISAAYDFRLILNKLFRYTIPMIIIYIFELWIKKIQDINLSPIENTKRFFLGGDGPGGYYYPVMIQVSFIFPIIFFLIKKYDVIGFIVCWGINMFYEICHASSHMSADVYRLIAFRYIFIIAFGCYLAIGKINIKVWKWIIMSTAATIFIIMTQYRGYTPVFLTDWTGTCLISVMFIFPFMAVLYNKDFDFYPLEVIGSASYNIFLVQKIYYCTPVCNYWYEHYGRIQQLVLNVVICTAVGIAFFKIETPLTKKITRIILR